MKMKNMKQIGDVIIERVRRITRASTFNLRRCTAWVMIFVLAWQTIYPRWANAAVRPARRAAAVRREAEPLPAQTAAEKVTVYGPQKFTRQSGTSIKEVRQFSLPTEVGAPFTVAIQNGAADGSNRVSSATIKLNGADLFTAKDFNQTVAQLNKAVTLAAANTLEVELTSAPGSYLTITFTATRTGKPPALLSSVAPARATQGQTLNVTLRGSNTHWLAGQTRASLGGEVSVGGAGYGEPGPVTVTDPTTAIAQVQISPTAALDPRTARVITPASGVNPEESSSLADAFTVAAATPPGASASKVQTIAGSAGAAGYADGTGGVARFSKLSGVAIGPDDTIYVADMGNQRIRAVRAQTDQTGKLIWNVTTLAGDGVAGFVDGPAGSARFNSPQGVAVDASGVVYVADTANNRIRRISANGIVSTLAGDGTAGLLDGAGTQARFNAPQGVAVDNQGNLYVADTGNSAIRIINVGGDVHTVAGDGTVGSSDSPNVRFDGLVGVAVDGTSVYAYLADTGNHRLRRLDPTGTVITIAGAERGFADGTAFQARFAEPSGVAIDGAGKIIVTDSVNSLVRLVDPDLSANGSQQAVMTLAGTGSRGLTDGTGDLARFFTPRGLAVSASSAIVIADTGNQVLRRILLPPIINAISPSSARLGDTVTIDGARFDARGTSRNLVRFTRSQQAGGGQTTAQVTQATRTSLTVVVPADAATGPVTVQTEGGMATSPSDFVVSTYPAPSITDFTPKHGPSGTEVTLTGTSLKVDGNSPVVTFAGANGAHLTALVTSASEIEVHALVPNAAITGPIELANAGGRATTAGVFTVDAPQDYQLTVAPSAATAVQGGAASYVVYLTSGQSNFSQLASLSATGLPAAVNAAFDPAQITAGASSNLTLKLSGTLAPGSYPFTISSTAKVEGRDVSRSINATLNVLAGGQTTLSGRVLSTEKEPIMGATVSLSGRTATTDAAGAFLLSGVSAGTALPLMVDGRTASAPNRTYPVILEPATIVAGQANAVPYTFYLPPIDTQYEVDVVPTQNTVATNPRVPGLQMTVPAGVNLHNRDGSPVARVSITPLAIDRTPAPLPSNVATAIVYTSQPGGAKPNTGLTIPVTYPNLSGLNPGTNVPLYAFNHDTVQWYKYGTGTVTQDGRSIVPDIDPSTGRRYGLLDFSWHFPGAGPGGNPGGPGKGKDKDCGDSNKGANPVDFSTGIKIETATDILFQGARGGLELTRTYTSDLAQFCDNCPFGRGTTHNYAVRLTGSFTAGGAGRVIMPEESTGRLFSYARTDSSGALVFTTTATVGQLGDVVRRLTDGTLEYRRADAVTMRFDSSGRMTAIVDRNGNTTTLTYTGGNLTTITDAVGRSLTLGYDFSSRITSITDPLNRTWRYTYEGTPGVAGNPGLTTVTDPLGNVTRYTYATGGRLASITDPRGNLVKQLTYDFNGRVATQKFADGGMETYAYSMSGGVVTSTTITDVLGHVTVKRFNAAGYVLTVTDPLGQMTQYTRDLTTNLATNTSGSCGCTEAARQYDERGNVISETDRDGHTTRLEYDANNNITKITDKQGRITSFSYDAHGNLSSMTNALNQTTTTLFDAFGQMKSVTDALGHTTQIEYDAYGNTTGIIDALGHRQTVEYDAIGRVLSASDPLGRKTSATYDNMDRALTSTSTSGAVTKYAYDNDGNLTSITDPLNRVWTFKYDARNRLTADIDPLGQTLRRQYNVKGQVIAILSPEGRTARYTYDQRGKVATITDPLGGVTSFTYDTKGNLTTLVDKRGNTTTYTYDALYRPTGSRNPLGQTSTVVYDANGQVSEATDRLGHHSSFTYDALNRLASATYADSQVAYTYDPANRLKRIDDTQSGPVEWNYDEAGRLLSETTPTGVVAYAYNDAGQRTSMTAGNRPPVTYGYDSAGRLQTITQATEAFTYSYDQLSRINGLSRPNAVTTSYSYDNAGRLERLRHTNGLSQAIEDYRYTYTKDDQIASIASLATSTQLPGSKTAGPADAANKLTQLGDVSYGFDARGQTTTKTDAQGTTEYSWDARGRMTQATLPNGQTVAYTYDALGRRASRSADGGTTSFLYDGQNVVQDRNSDGSTIDYLNGLGVDSKLRQTSSATGSLYFLKDHLGSTAMLTNSNGGVVESQQYEAFGASSGSALTRYGFTGRERDAATGLLYYRARWYDPQQGRFISEDPAGLRGGLNFYAYAGNDPLNFVDPLGLSWATFKQGLLEGGASGLFWGLLIGALFAALEAATAGTAAAVIVPILAIIIGAKAANDIINEIIALITQDMCPDERHYRIGYLIGSTIGAIAGGAATGGLGGGGAAEEGAGGAGGSGVGDLVDLTDARGRTHILDGDATGGGHRPGTGIPGKSEFPSNWSDEQILHNISDVATDPASTRTTQSNGRIRVDGTRDGVDIRVILDPANGGRIVTGFPTNLPRNP